MISELCIGSLALELKRRFLDWHLTRFWKRALHIYIHIYPYICMYCFIHTYIYACVYTHIIYIYSIFTYICTHIYSKSSCGLFVVVSAFWYQLGITLDSIYVWANCVGAVVQCVFWTHPHFCSRFFCPGMSSWKCVVGHLEHWAVGVLWYIVSVGKFSLLRWCGAGLWQSVCAVDMIDVFPLFLSIHGGSVKACLHFWWRHMA